MSMNRLAPSALAVAFVAVACGFGCRTAAPVPTTTPVTPPTTVAVEVPTHAEVGVYLLALCPHAARALHSLSEAASQLGPAIQVHVAFLGLLDEAGDPSQRMGQPELDAALVHLCVQNVASQAQWKTYLGCAFAEDKFRRGKSSALSCATQVGLDAPEMELCAASADAQAELRSMYATSMALDIDQSPTIVVDRRVYLGETEAEAFASYLCHNAGEESTRPGVCASVPAPATVTATMLFDSRCQDPEMCDVEGKIEALNAMIPGLVLTRLDYLSPEGKHLFELVHRAESQIEQLPLVLFDDTLSSAGVSAKRLEPYLVEFGPGRLLPMGAGWNPQAELCGNGVDDTGNGLVDCGDPTCQSTLACRPESKGKVELFIMSQCPFGAAVLGPAWSAVQHFGKNPKKMGLRLEFVGESRNGELVSMHGQSELDEDLRMICAQELYPQKYLFMDYVTCRAKDFRAADWKACLPKGMSAKKLEACATSDKGSKLLAKSFELAQTMGVRGSPSWILNGRYPLEARTMAAIVEGFCERNQLPECAKPVPTDEAVAVGGAKAPAPGSCR